MASFNKFYQTVNDIGLGVLDLNTDTIKVMLTNTLPVATNHVYSDISGGEVANGNGYTTGGGTVTGTGYTNSSGTSTLAGSAFTWTSSTGNMGPFRYVVAYDSTPATKTLLGWWDYGSSVTLNGVNADQFVWAPVSSIIFTNS